MTARQEADACDTENRPPVVGRAAAGHRANHGWPVRTRVMGALVVGTFLLGVAHGAEETASRFVAEGWPQGAVVAFERIGLGEQSVVQGDVIVLYPDRTVPLGEIVQRSVDSKVEGVVRTEVVAIELPSFGAGVVLAQHPGHIGEAPVGE